ncbi:MAG: hypothetical protein NXI16_10340 [Alphaproteobacteria bacterium]|nr:hypothetical protein [Alphaproteobacteria bacterium]
MKFEGPILIAAPLNSADIPPGFKAVSVSKMPNAVLLARYTATTAALTRADMNGDLGDVPLTLLEAGHKGLTYWVRRRMSENPDDFDAMNQEFAAETQADIVLLVDSYDLLRSFQLDREPTPPAFGF